MTSRSFVCPCPKVALDGGNIDGFVASVTIDDGCVDQQNPCLRYRKFIRIRADEYLDSGQQWIKSSRRYSIASALAKFRWEHVEMATPLELKGGSRPVPHRFSDESKLWNTLYHLALVNTHNLVSSIRLYRNSYSIRMC